MSRHIHVTPSELQKGCRSGCNSKSEISGNSSSTDENSATIQKKCFINTKSSGSFLGLRFFDREITISINAFSGDF